MAAEIKVRELSSGKTEITLTDGTKLTIETPTSEQIEDVPKVEIAKATLALIPLVPVALSEGDNPEDRIVYLGDLEDKAYYYDEAGGDTYENYRVACRVFHKAKYDPVDTADVLLNLSERLRTEEAFARIVPEDRNVFTGMLAIEIAQYYPEGWKREKAPNVYNG